MSEAAVEQDEQIETPQSDESGAEQQDQGEQAEQQSETGDSGELVITLGDEQQQEEEQNRAPEWVKNLRKEHRELQRQKRELEQQLQAAKQPQKQSELGPKPTLEGCDFDADKFESELTAWHEQKRQIDAKAESERKAAESAQAEWATRVNAYNDAKSKLPVSDFEDSESAVQGALDQVKQAIILSAAEKPEQLIYALGKSEAKLKELASIKDPVKFTWAVAKLESTMKVTQRKPATQAEKVIQGSGGTRMAVDNTLDKLREEALRTGDASKLFEYKRQQRAKQ